MLVRVLPAVRSACSLLLFPARLFGRGGPWGIAIVFVLAVGFRVNVALTDSLSPLRAPDHASSSSAHRAMAHSLGPADQHRGAPRIYFVRDVHWPVDGTVEDEVRWMGVIAGLTARDVLVLTTILFVVGLFFNHRSCTVGHTFEAAVLAMAVASGSSLAIAAARLGWGGQAPAMMSRLGIWGGVSLPALWGLAVAAACLAPVWRRKPGAVSAVLVILGCAVMLALAPAR